MSSGCAFSDEAARLRFDRLVDSADRLVLKRHRMLDAEDAVLRLRARAVFNQVLHTVSARNEGVNQVAIERIGCGAHAPQGDAVFGLALLQLQGKLTTGSQPPCQFTRGNSEGLP